MEYHKINELQLSMITAGLMRFEDETNLEEFILSCLEQGINTFDTADIYQRGANELLLGQFIKKHPHLRSKMHIISKCGIVFPGFKEGVSIGHLDHTYDHIINSVKTSLTKLNTSYLDLILIHRPSPISNYLEMAKALAFLKKEGLVKEIGVSNFYPQQCDALQFYLNEYGLKIVANQIEINPFSIEHFKNYNFEYMSINNIVAMAWSPLGGLYHHLDNPSNEPILTKINELAVKYQVDSVEIIYAWTNSLPIKPIIVTGTTKLSNLDLAIKSF
ncbi:MAG: aldo/keto reductase, partial [Bacilli bacterium]